jgi:hypothetical protein
MLLASFDAHPAAVHKAFATHSAFSDSSFPSSRETAYRPVRASNDSTIDGISISMSPLALQLPDLCAPATDKVLLQKDHDVNEQHEEGEDEQLALALREPLELCDWLSIKAKAL